MSKPKINEIGVRSMLRRQCRAAGSQKAWADLHKVSESFVSDVLRGRRDVSDYMASCLGLQRVIMFEAED